MCSLLNKFHTYCFCGKETGIIGAIACPVGGKPPAGYICLPDPPECDEGLPTF